MPDAASTPPWIPNTISRRSPMTTTSGEVPFRILPRITDRNAHFWEGGRDGELRFQRCRTCGYYLHPPAVICPKDWSKDIGIEAGSGRAEVLTFSINYQPWTPGLEPPFVLPIPPSPAQPPLRLTHT